MLLVVNYLLSKSWVLVLWFTLCLYLHPSSKDGLLQYRTNKWTPIPGDVVFCQRLKQQKQGNKTYLNQRINTLYRSYAVVLDPPITRERINIAWLGDCTLRTSIGVKQRFLRPIPRLVFHFLESYEWKNGWMVYKVSPTTLTKEEKMQNADVIFERLISNHQRKESTPFTIINYPLDDRKLMESRKKYVCSLKPTVSKEDLSLMHLIEEWYDRSYNSTVEMHVAVRTRNDAFNKANLMRLSRMMYQDNEWKRTTFGRISTSGDLILFRRLLKRQVQFVMHSKLKEEWILLQEIIQGQMGVIMMFAICWQALLNYVSSLKE